MVTPSSGREMEMPSIYMSLYNVEGYIKSYVYNPWKLNFLEEGTSSPSLDKDGKR